MREVPFRDNLWQDHKEFTVVRVLVAVHRVTEAVHSCREADSDPINLSTDYIYLRYLKRFWNTIVRRSPTPQSRTTWNSSTRWSPIFSQNRCITKTLSLYLQKINSTRDLRICAQSIRTLSLLVTSCSIKWWKLVITDGKMHNRSTFKSFSFTWPNLLMVFISTTSKYRQEFMRTIFSGM